MKTRCRQCQRKARNGRVPLKQPCVPARQHWREEPCICMRHKALYRAFCLAFTMAVFVLDKHHKPLMPCSEGRARCLLQRGRARVHRLNPFTIRLVDRLAENSVVDGIQVKIDPGSTETGIAIVRSDDNGTHALHFCSLTYHPDSQENAAAGELPASPQVCQSQVSCPAF